MRMYNSGVSWRGHLSDLREQLLAHLPSNPTVVEIGCGSGEFLQGLCEHRPGRYIGFDPQAREEGAIGTVEIRQCLFSPLEHISELKPNLIVIRHVLEHLLDPFVLLERMAWAASLEGLDCKLFAEVPCIDVALRHGRLADFYYEHYSQFTTRSFEYLIRRAGKLMSVAHGYGDEVVFGLATLGVPAEQLESAVWTDVSLARVSGFRIKVAAQLDAMVDARKRVVIWGGVGKAASFMNYYGLDAERFPLVVDSDMRKVGSHVPGTGQLIQSIGALKDECFDVLLIPANWRVRDVMQEAERLGVRFAVALIEHEGELVDPLNVRTPYL
ncbi:methyltransferase domain-containing protein [Azoarcus sp. L1K30]|uniref:class I SAM-dependent methyltransferase n=1 Tax=Azoarcus sp. L1K30 TaxID=2820277 RepID=UPI001B83D492|nr:class I SAM-dependent methyltransferase [Azoarcus sp. L1K30]MBR0568016.1 methyltransferase domain-containing protein [Azoarcus sp. L1K30]